MEGTLLVSVFPYQQFPPNLLKSRANLKPFFEIRGSSTRAQHSTTLGKRHLHYHTKKRKRFFEEDAFPSSLPLHSRNPRAIYKDIQRFAKENKLKEALTIMDYVDQQGIPVNPTTFSAVIASCIRSKNLTFARQIHAHIRINGLENNEFLRTKLVQLYSACGSVEDAQQVFNECTCTSVYPWNALLRGTVLSGGRKYPFVLSAYKEMRELGVELNVYTFCNVIKSFAGASALKQGLKTHALLVKNGMLGSSILMTSLVDMYSKCGKVKLAHKVFEETLDRDIVVWGAMIAGFAHNRRQWESLDYTRWMVREGLYPNSVILTTILPGIGEVKARKLGQEVHGYIMKMKNFSRLLSVQSGLIDMYCKCGDINSGRRVFYGSSERSTVSWTALMSGYVSNGRLEQALRSIVWMQQEGFKPDVVTVVTVIPVCGELGALKAGKEIHAYAVKNFFLPNVSVSTSLIKMYSDCGNLQYSIQLFNGMEKRNVISWTAIIDSCGENGCMDEAFNLFRSMQLSQHRPDSIIMARMLNICSETKALKLGKEIHGQVLKKDFELVPSVSSGIIKMYGSCGLISIAKLVFDAIAVKGSMTWTAIIEAYGNQNLWRDAINLFNEMISLGFTPNGFTFKIVLKVCDQAGFVEDACSIFKLMSQREEIKSSDECQSILFGLLKRCGRIDEALRFVDMSTLSRQWEDQMDSLASIEC